MYDLSSDSEDYDQHQSQLPPNPALALAQHPRIVLLRSILSESLFYCCGTADLPSPGLVLFYGKDERARRIDVANASPSALNDLEKACDPDDGQQDVFDISHGIAGKLDKDHFSLNLDVERVGLLDAVRTGLLSTNDGKKPIRAELYKLNVYGKNSFFRPHKDIPRGATMFGSLVLVLASPHEGGTLVLRHENHEYAFDASQHLSDIPPPAMRIAYVAFLNDVEQEVKAITSGHRITITYNLHFVDERDVESRFTAGLDMIQPRGTNVSEVKAKLKSLLSDPTFLPEGGTLGFGLRHPYSLPTTFDTHDDDTLEVLKQRLKGADAALLSACISHCLVPSLYSIYEDSHDDASRILVACPRVAKINTHDYDHDEEIWQKLCRQFDGFLVNPSQTAIESLSLEPLASRRRSVHWVTPLSQVNRVKTRFAAYANVPMMGYLYQRICILVAVGPAGRRCDTRANE
ncbi:hypothetical protein C8T65DRAFT_798125 [Cerioporus squamosus]|nr:hypothetical protein C8T65DRAFT_798125 [Cerioporus squamosus]